VAVAGLLTTLIAFAFQTRTMLFGSLARAVAGMVNPATTRMTAARPPRYRRIEACRDRDIGVLLFPSSPPGIRVRSTSSRA
jgi:hypothetical protein